MPARQRSAAWPRDVLDVEIAQARGVCLLASVSIRAMVEGAPQKELRARWMVWNPWPCRLADAPRRRCNPQPERR